MNRWLTMQERVADYLTVRRRLGFALRIEGEQLQRFASFADAQGHDGAITIDLALAWACASQRSGPIGRARRLEIVRALAKFCVPFEIETQVPPVRLLGPAHRRLPPHIYTDEELTQLLAAAANLEPMQGLRPASMECLLGLLAATGLRVSEALHLQQGDVDLGQGLLTVRHTFACNRLLRWYQEGIDVHWAMPLLTTYLGHVKVTDTYWYLTAIPALMAIAAERFECVATSSDEEVTS